MKNADMPASPVQGFTADQYFLHAGLTKRELFAAMAMQGFIASDHANGSEKRLNEDNAAMAIEAADALLAELEPKPKATGGGE